MSRAHGSLVPTLRAQGPQILFLMRLWEHLGASYTASPRNLLHWEPVDVSFAAVKGSTAAALLEKKGGLPGLAARLRHDLIHIAPGID